MGFTRIGSVRFAPAARRHPARPRNPSPKARWVSGAGLTPLSDLHRDGLKQICIPPEVRGIPVENVQVHAAGDAGNGAGRTVLPETPVRPGPRYRGPGDVPMGDPEGA